MIHLRGLRADLSRVRGEEPLQYRTDYVLRLIEELGGLIRLALEKVGAGSISEKRDLVGQAIEIDATALEESGDPVAAAFRREQAGAVRSLLGTTTRGVAMNPTPGGEGGE